MEALDKLGDWARDELGFLIEASWKPRSGLCRVFGLWMDIEEEKSQLFLVSERFDLGMGDLMKEERKKFGLLRFGIIGLELCEAVMGLHSEGIVCGCLSLSCFCFDDYGHCLLDLSKVLLLCRRIWELNHTKTEELVAPEVLLLLHDKNHTKDRVVDGSVGYGLDVWSLACVLIMLLTCDAHLAVELNEGLIGLTEKGKREEFIELYDGWKKKVVDKVEELLVSREFESLVRMFDSCLSYQPESRPHVSDVWYCFRGLFGKTCLDDLVDLDAFGAKESVRCCLLNNLSSLGKEGRNVRCREENGNLSRDVSGTDLEESGEHGERDDDHHKEEKVDGESNNSINSGGFKSVTLQGHRDCVTGIAVGGTVSISKWLTKVC